MRESAAFEVGVTVRLTAVITFAEAERDRPIDNDDALGNFYGCGLSEVLDSGEYEYDVSDIRVRRL